MKKGIMIFIITIGMFCLFCNNAYCVNGKKHKEAWEAMWAVPIMFGGLGKGIPLADLSKLQKLIDFNGGKGHRHTRTHDPKRAFEVIEKIPSLLNHGWNPKSVFNAIVIHNILDMANSNTNGGKPTGTNNWEATEKRVNKAKKLKQKIDNGKRIYGGWPKWASKLGGEIPVKLFNNIIKKFSIIVDKTPKNVKKFAGPVIYITYEGTTFTYNIISGKSTLEEEIVNVIGITVGTICSIGGAKISAIAAAPMNAIPGVGQALYFITITSVSIGSGFAGNYITTLFIDLAELDIKFV